MKKKCKILHCLKSVGGNPQGLSRAERLLGANSTSMCVRQNVYKYDTDIVLTDEKSSIYSIEIRKWKFFFKAIEEYDIFHFNFGGSFVSASDFHFVSRNRLGSLERLITEVYLHFLQNFDLRLLRRRKKVIFVTYQGDDARQWFFSSNNFSISIGRELGENYYSYLDDIVKRRSIKAFSRFASKIYSVNPDLLWVLPPSAEFLPYCHFDVESCVPVPPSIDGPLRIAHAPTHRGAKGSSYILEAINRLENEGYNVHLDLIEGVSHTEAVERLRKADVLIDQVLAGWYGGVSVELMAMAKPVLCYVRECDMRFVPREMREDLPIIEVTPSNIYHVLKELLSAPRGQIVARGIASRDFALKWHNPVTIAKKVLSDYQKALIENGYDLGISGPC